MISFSNDGVFASKAQTLVIPCNGEGILNSELDRFLKDRFSDAYTGYKWQCAFRKIMVGKPYMHKAIQGQSIIFFPTKTKYNDAAVIAGIEEGLRVIAAGYRGWGVTSMSIPLVGSKDLDAGRVRQAIMQYLGGLDIPVEVCT